MNLLIILALITLFLGFFAIRFLKGTRGARRQRKPLPSRPVLPAVVPIVAALAIAAMSPSALAASNSAHVLVRVGADLQYNDCIVATNILEPADAGASHLVLNSCVMTASTQTIGPSWIVDEFAVYGSATRNGVPLGRCWLIRHQLIASNPTMTIECEGDTVLDSGFEER